MKEYSFCPLCGVSLEVGMIEGKQRRYCPHCDFIDYKNPLPVALAIAVKDKKFLLIKRGLAPKKGMWASPSGFIEVGETPEDACLRELEEETGASGQIVRLLSAVRVADTEVYGDMLILEYLVKVVDDNLIPGDEVEEARFFDIEELPDYFVDFFGEVIEEIKVEG